MRVNLRKIFGLSLILFLIWFVIAYLSVVDVPTTNVNSKLNVIDLENKIDYLEKQSDLQLSDSNKLLDTINTIRKYNNGKGYRIADNKYKEDGVRPIIPVLVISCNRVTVKRCLDNLVKFRPNKEIFPIIVSQDCGHNETYQVIKTFTETDPTITVIQQPDLSEIFLPKHKIKFRGYYNIARHFKFALNHVLSKLGHEAVIIIEDDLDISPDLFEYFLGTYPLLLKDPSLWCISAWNDNGKKELIDMSRSELLYRTDFFPGLGWMLAKGMWEKLEPKWPKAFFDDWLRDPVNTDGKACIRPEISRTYSFGKVGVSKGLYFDLHLRHMQLNMDFVEFTKLNLSYLLKNIYDETFLPLVYASPKMSAREVMATTGTQDSDVVWVPYSDAKSFQKAAKLLGLMEDFRNTRVYIHG